MEGWRDCATKFGECKCDGRVRYGKKGKKIEKDLEVAPRITRASKASVAQEVWQRVDFLNVGPKITAASNVTPGEVWTAIDFLEVGPKLTNVIQRGNEKSINQASST